MSTMCYVCGSEQTKVGSEYYCKICHRPFCQDCEKSEKSSVLDGEYLVWSCKSCSERYGKESLRPNGFSPYTTPLISPIPSMSSFGSSVSSCGDFPADMNSQNREAGDEALDTGQEHSNLEFKDHSEERGTESLLKNIDIECSNAITSSDRLGCPMSTEEICTSGSISVENHEDSNGEKVGFRRSTSQDVRSMRAADDSDGAENAIDSSGSSFLSKIETDPLLWMPPEPEDLEDVLDSVANNDDDDDYSDGTKWGQPSSLSSFDEETGSNYSYKEERQKAMVEAMNGQFKILVSRFLASEGIAFSAGEAGKSWLDIVASLSWEAALLVKPDANAGRAMDPGSYVKVKCIASGSRSQSQVIKGLVFKKNTAHKHMPIKWRNPRLLLLQGILGHSAVGLSSFDSMEQENYFLKSIIEMIETCHPNVVLVEKTVSRDVQESLLAKGITLVFDMKLPRLERISRCTGSQVISSADILMNPKLKQCDSFHIEKFVEEHNTSGEGGKRPTKTLMFLEGFPKPLGCTILLKGAHSDELKKVKRVVHYTIFAAYHLILETSFFADQRAIFSEMNTVRDENYSFTDKQVPSVGCGQAFNLNTPFLGGPGGASAHALDILISDRSLDKSAHGETCFNSDMDVEGSSTLPGFHPDLNGNNFVQRDLLNTEPNGSEVFQPDSSQDSSVPPLLPGQLLTSFSTLKKILGDSFPPLTSVSYGSFSSYFGFKEKELDGQSVDVFSASPSPRALNYEIGENGSISQEKPQDGICDGETAETERGFTESSEHCIADGSNEVQMQNKDDIESVLDPQSILVLLSSQCISKQCVCEQSHLSRIKYYGNFDVSLGRFLHDILLNQKHSCSECGEPPEGHVYCYTHQNGNLTVLVRRLPPESLLSGEAEGKIWMWTRCLKCERERGIPRSTRRVVMSTAARGLSFGKFLELSFSSHSAANRLSRCGHSLHRDCLRFFGLGSRVAMFRYSPVEIYAACKPPPVLEFYNPNGQEWFKREARDVLEKGNLLFSGVADLLQKLKPRISGSRKEFVIVEEMLMQEKAEFEASLLKAINQNGQLGQTAHEILGLKWLNQELLLELYVWDRRLHSLLLCTGGNGASLNAIHEEQFQREKDAISYNRISERDATEDVGKLLEVPIQTVIHEEKFPPEKDGMSCDRIVERNATENDDKILEDPMQITINIEESSSSDGSYHARNHSNLVSELKVDVADISGNASSRNHNSQDVGSLIEFNSSASEVHTISVLDKDPCSKPSDLSSTPLNKLGNQEDCMPISDHMQVNQDISNTTGIVWCAENITDSEQKTYETISGGEMSDKSIFKEQQSGIYVSQGSPNSELTDPEGWVWTPFSEMRMAYRNDFHGGYPQKFQFIYTYTLMYLSPLRQLITQEMDLLHFPVGTDGNVISVCEDEISGIIAAALALSQDQYSLQENIVERETGKDKGEASKAIDDMYSLASEDSVASSYWSSTGYVDPEGIRSAQTGTSLTSDLSTLSTEGLLFVDRLIASENLHPEIHVGVGKIAGKSKYSVVCIHAKQFYELRKSCCPSELAYISSLSRCKKWDAQGGKSKALFLKSMDDRFIIKQIKKTELDSFLKFAPDYFKHISHSVSSGSQTCLAKILGIYQVRQTRSGKEVKTDLMVMENLLFARKMSRTYDLKGAVHSRYISESNDPGRVLLDQNFVEDMRVSPMYVGGRTKHLLQRAIWNDTSFLTSINVMDYSLLVGVDKERHELVFGIIDYLRQYTWDKQLETWVKASLVVPKNALPTVVSPKEYKKRFRKFMTKYFLTVPDTWSSSERCSGPCKFCSDGSNKCSKLQNARLPD